MTKEELYNELVKSLLVLNFKPKDIAEHKVEILQQLHYEFSIDNVNIVSD